MRAAVLDDGGCWSAAMANAVEIKVLSSQAIKEAYLAFAPEFERVSGHKLNTTWNGTIDILKKLRAGEVFDMVILVTPSMEAMIKEGKVVAGKPRRSRALRHRHRRPDGRAETRHRHGRRGEARAARGQRHRLFVRPERRVSRRACSNAGASGIRSPRRSSRRRPVRRSARSSRAATSTSVSSRSASSCSIPASSMSVRCRRRWTPSASSPAASTPARRNRTRRGR